MSLAKTEYQIGDFVIYKNNGLCCISEIIDQDFGAGVKTYYILKQQEGLKSSYYVPKDLEGIENFMRKTIDKKSVEKAIKNVESKDVKWIDDGKERALVFNKVMTMGPVEDILYVYKVLVNKKRDAESIKKRLYLCDERTLTTAEKLITQEFSYALGIDKEEVIPYIIKVANKTKNKGN